MVIILTPIKKTTHSFAWIIYVALALVLAVIAALNLVPGLQPAGNMLNQENPQSQDITINFNALHSDQIANLEPFDATPTTFNYVAKSKNGKQVSGQIIADNSVDAQTMLQAQNLTIVNLQEAVAGRSDPFNSYSILQSPTGK